MSNFRVGDRVVFKHWNEPYPWLAGTVTKYFGPDMIVEIDEHYHEGCGRKYNFTPNGGGGEYQVETVLEEVFHSPLYKALL